MCSWKRGPYKYLPRGPQTSRQRLLRILVWLPYSRSSNRAPRAHFPSVDLLVWAHSPGTLSPLTPLIRSGGGPGMCVLGSHETQASLPQPHLEEQCIEVKPGCREDQSPGQDWKSPVSVLRITHPLEGAFLVSGNFLQLSLTVLMFGRPKSKTCVPVTKKALIEITSW